SAIEHLFALAIVRNEHFVVDTGFPVEATGNKFEKTLKNRKIEERLPDLCAVLRELKPYKTGNSALWWLHALNGAEKHKSLVPIVGAKTFQKIEFTAQGSTTTKFIQFAATVAEGWFRNDEDHVFMALPIESALDPKIQFQMGVSFSEIEATKFEPM